MTVPNKILSTTGPFNDGSAVLRILGCARVSFKTRPPVGSFLAPDRRFLIVVSSCFLVSCSQSFHFLASLAIPL